MKSTMNFTLDYKIVKRVDGNLVKDLQPSVGNTSQATPAESNDPRVQNTLVYTRYRPRCFDGRNSANRSNGIVNPIK